MLEIRNIQIDGKAGNRTDHLEPELTFALESDVPGTSLAEASVTACGQTFDCGNDQTGFPLKGLALQPFTEYPLEIRVRDNHGQEAAAAASFRTGRWKLPVSYTHLDVYKRQVLSGCKGTLSPQILM